MPNILIKSNFISVTVKGEILGFEVKSPAFMFSIEDTAEVQVERMVSHKSIT